MKSQSQRSRRIMATYGGKIEKKKKEKEKKKGGTKQTT
jgi:hypothetical protein